MSDVKGWAGRKIVIKDSDGDAIAGVNSKTFSVEREGINVTSDDEEGFQTMLGEPGTVAFNMSVEGFIKTADGGNTDLVESALDTDTLLEEYTIEFPWGKQARGDFFLGNFEITGEVAEGITFSAELNSSGIIEYEDIPS